nr:proline-rich protein 12-like [Caretta caretta]
MGFTGAAQLQSSHGPGARRKSRAGGSGKAKHGDAPSPAHSHPLRAPCRKSPAGALGWLPRTPLPREERRAPGRQTSLPPASPESCEDRRAPARCARSAPPGPRASAHGPSQPPAPPPPRSLRLRLAPSPERAQRHAPSLPTPAPAAPPRARAQPLLTHSPGFSLSLRPRLAAHRLGSPSPVPAGAGELPSAPLPVARRHVSGLAELGAPGAALRPPAAAGAAFPGCAAPSLFSLRSRRRLGLAPGCKAGFMLQRAPRLPGVGRQPPELAAGRMEPAAAGEETRKDPPAGEARGRSPAAQLGCSSPSAGRAPASRGHGQRVPGPRRSSRRLSRAGQRRSAGLSAGLSGAQRTGGVRYTLQGQRGAAAGSAVGAVEGRWRGLTGLRPCLVCAGGRAARSLPPSSPRPAPCAPVQPPCLRPLPGSRAAALHRASRAGAPQPDRGRPPAGPRAPAAACLPEDAYAERWHRAEQGPASPPPACEASPEPPQLHLPGEVLRPRLSRLAAPGDGRCSPRSDARSRRCTAPGRRKGPAEPRGGDRPVRSVPAPSCGQVTPAGNPAAGGGFGDCVWPGLWVPEPGASCLRLPSGPVAGAWQRR